MDHQDSSSVESDNTLTVYSYVFSKDRCTRLYRPPSGFSRKVIILFLINSFWQHLCFDLLQVLWHLLTFSVVQGSLMLMQLLHQHITHSLFDNQHFINRVLKLKWTLIRACFTSCLLFSSSGTHTRHRCSDFQDFMQPMWTTGRSFLYFHHCPFSDLNKNY